MNTEDGGIRFREKFIITYQITQSHTLESYKRRAKVSERRPQHFIWQPFSFQCSVINLKSNGLSSALLTAVLIKPQT